MGVGSAVVEPTIPLIEEAVFMANTLADATKFGKRRNTTNKILKKADNLFKDFFFIRKAF